MQEILHTIDIALALWKAWVSPVKAWVSLVLVLLFSLEGVMFEYGPVRFE
jgi:hypothetical protein